ncbi:MAG: glutathione-dependent reductase, partial [Marinobacter sp. 34-60-7]
DKYEQAYTDLFESLDWLEGLLAERRYLTGSQITEADWRLFTTLIRFDAVYYSHFKCNRQQIRDYPNLSGYLRELYQQPGVAETVSIDQIKRHYYVSQRTINPTQVVPVGPVLDFDAAHGREGIGQVS